MVCRNRAYADRAYSSPPSIENAAQHPFLRQFDEAEDGDSAEGAAAGSEAEQRSRTATPVPQAIPAPATKQAAAAAQAKAAAEKPPAQLFDLLSMDDVSCCLDPAPVVLDTCCRRSYEELFKVHENSTWLRRGPLALQGHGSAPAAPAAVEQQSHDDWAAFMEAPAAPSSSASAAAPEDHWDAFQVGRAGHLECYIAVMPSLQMPATGICARHAQYPAGCGL